MGEMSDYYLEQGIGDEFYEDRPQPTATTWVTRDGQRIPVSDMSDAHLVNTIRYLRRTASLALMDHLNKCIDSGTRSIWEDVPEEAFDEAEDISLKASVPTFRAMLAEAEKRGLKVE
jgi:hypothetical protein